MILRGIFQVVSGFPLHFMLYRGTLDFFSAEAGAELSSQNMAPAPAII